MMCGTVNRLIHSVVLAVIVAITCAAVCLPPYATEVTSTSEVPVVNVPKPLRQINWLGSQNEGSCCWASLITTLHWEGQHNLAQWVRANCGNGENPDSLARDMAAYDVPFAVTYGDQDVAFLEQALAGRRGVMVAVDGGSHMVVLCHLDAERACIIDNNNPNHDEWMTRAQFLTEWTNAGSWAVVPLFSPVPPLSL
jgi:hypothetical protein